MILALVFFFSCVADKLEIYGCRGEAVEDVTPDADCQLQSNPGARIVPKPHMKVVQGKKKKKLLVKLSSTIVKLCLFTHSGFALTISLQNTLEITMKAS